MSGTLIAFHTKHSQYGLAFYQDAAPGTYGLQMTEGGDSGSAIYDLDPHGQGTAEVIGMRIGRSRHTRDGHLFHTQYAENQFRGGINTGP